MYFLDPAESGPDEDLSSSALAIRGLDGRSKLLDPPIGLGDPFIEATGGLGGVWGNMEAVGNISSEVRTRRRRCRAGGGGLTPTCFLGLAPRKMRTRV